MRGFRYFVFVIAAWLGLSAWLFWSGDTRRALFFAGALLVVGLLVIRRLRSNPRAPSLLSSGETTELPFSREKVFEALVEAVPRTKMKLKEADQVTGKIVAATGMSAFSWGEDVALVVEAAGGGNARIRAISEARIQDGLFDFGKNRKNIDRLLKETRKTLEREQGVSELVSK